MARGGKRPGSGAPKGHPNYLTADKIEARARARALIAPHMPPMIAAQIANAQGLSYLVYRDKDSGRFERVKDIDDIDQDKNAIEVWEKDPSVQAFTDLMNRLLDKPAEQKFEIDITAKVSVEDRLQAARKRLASAKKG